MSSPLHFAIIGCGKIAPRHAAEAIKYGKLAAVCDIIPDRADALAKEFNATPYYRAEDLLSNEKGLDLVAICTPNGLHALHSIISLQSGHHVLCEKPLSISVTDAKKMIEAAEIANKKLFVVKSSRYNPVISSLKKMIESGHLRNIYSFQLNCFWNRPEAYYTDSWKGGELDGGSLFTQFSHYIDALLWMLGNIKHVTGHRKNMAHKNTILMEDTGNVSIEMESGVLGGLNWSVNSFLKNMEVSLTILAENGSIRIGGEYMNKIDYQVTRGKELQLPASLQANDYGFYKGSMSNHDKVYENLVKALQDPAHPFTNAWDGLKTVEAIEKIYNSVPLS